MEDWTKVSQRNPSRQGFYKVQRAAAADTCVAEWREYDKKQGKRWWEHRGDSPTAVKKPVELTDVVAFSKASQADIDKALKRELTVDEHIENAYKAYLMQADLYPEYTVNPPPRRALAVGDSLHLGNLQDVKVVALRNEGRVVIYSHRDFKTRHGQVLRDGTAYGASLWVYVTKKIDAVAPKHAQKSLLEGSFTSSLLFGLIRNVTCGLEFDADYQRGYAWTEEDQQRYLDTLMEGRDLGRFILVRRNYPLAEQVLDGKQRLTCLAQFVRSEIAWRGVYWDQLSPADRYVVESRTIQVARLAEEDFGRAGLLRVFLEVNAAGVPQTEEHLNHVKALLAAAEKAETASQNT